MIRVIKNLWCSVHQPTEEQVEELTSHKGGYQQELVFLKTINPELQGEINNIQLDTNLSLLANKLVSTIISGNYQPIQVGGSPAFLMAVGAAYGEMNSPLSMERSPKYPKFSFSKRISEDIPQDDGTTKKVSIFKHEGWV